MEPLSSGSQDRAFISRGYDATSHFETTVRPGAASHLPVLQCGCTACGFSCLACPGEHMVCSGLRGQSLHVQEGMQALHDVAQAWWTLGELICASPSMHVRAQVEDVLELYTRITGRVLDLSSKDPARAQAQE